MVENGRRKGGRQGTNGLCVVTKTNAGSNRHFLPRSVNMKE